VTGEETWPKSRLWLAGAVALLLLAAAWRLYALELRPVHHDEGVNGFFLTRLVRQGEYRYDPNNYHGPTLYYAAWAVVQVTGLNTFSIRLVTVIAGLLTLMVVLGLWPVIGRRGALWAAALLAISPGMVFFSRYFIHEMLVVLFTAGTAAALLHLRRGWRPGRVLLLSLSAALLFATKETAALHVGVLGLAALLSWGLAGARPRPRALLERLGRRERVHLLWAAGLFVLVDGLLYSSFLTNPRGVIDAFRSLAVWSHTGQSAHVNPAPEHVIWLSRADPVIMALGGASVLWAAWRWRRDPVATFLALWALGVLAAYSAVPYKTPWLGLNVLLPLAILAGYFLGSAGRWLRWVAVPVAAAGLLVSGWQSADLELRRYDDESHPYVYAHTKRGFVGLVDRIERLAAASPQGHALPMTVTTPEHWPLPWYLRDYTGVGYFGKVPTPLGGEVIVGAPAQRALLLGRLGTNYVLLGEFPLRPGARLILLARRDLVAAER